MNIQNLVDLIRENPGKFLQDDSVFQLMAFLRGFCLAKNVTSVQAGGNPSLDHTLLDTFGEHIRSTYSSITEAVSVDEVLTDVSPEAAFELFFKEWSKFINVRH